VSDQIDKYRVVIWWAEEYGHFLGEIPDLPGCMADGATQEEVLANIRVIASEWIELSLELGNPIPEPRPVPWPVDDPVSETQSAA
jgi:predicted RNase H-like HicB family nuclease